MSPSEKKKNQYPSTEILQFESCVNQGLSVNLWSALIVIDVLISWHFLKNSNRMFYFVRNWKKSIFVERLHNNYVIHIKLKCAFTWKKPACCTGS